MDAYYVAAASILGLILGSFATAVSYRVPRGESIASGRSKCPSCGYTITAAENVPLFSWIFLRGRCRNCGQLISIRYPLTELASGILFGLAVWKFGLTLEGALYAAFFWALLVLTVIDFEHKLLPNKIVFPTFIVGSAGLALAAAIDGDLGRLAEAGLGALIFGGFFFLIAFVYPAGMGGGDVKLAIVLGLFLGYIDAPGVVLVGMFLSFVLGGIVGIGALLIGGAGRKTQLPFGPFLALGSVIAVFVGRWLLDAYLGTI